MTMHPMTHSVVTRLIGVASAPPTSGAHRGPVNCSRTGALPAFPCAGAAGRGQSGGG